MRLEDCIVRGSGKINVCGSVVVKSGHATLTVTQTASSNLNLPFISIRRGEENKLNQSVTPLAPLLLATCLPRTPRALGAHLGIASSRHAYAHAHASRRRRLSQQLWEPDLKVSQRDARCRSSATVRLQTLQLRVHALLRS